MAPSNINSPPNPISQKGSPNHPIEASPLQARRERVFLVLAGLFLGSMTMLNILGISRFIKIYSFDYVMADGSILPITFALAVGVLPYPVTFLCTDFISEFYGRKRANWVVIVGVLLNAWVVFILWLGGVLPGFETWIDGQPGDASGNTPPFFAIRTMAFGAVGASMVAYLAAQLCDVHLFHFWKRFTGGKHLWLRNNGSTMISQLVDTAAVIMITYLFVKDGLPLNDTVNDSLELTIFIATGYVIKILIAAVDTIPFYFGVAWLKRYLQFDPQREL
jgi:uncharacterized integral membrane protein (TIGR00697 family)